MDKSSEILLALLRHSLWGTPAGDITVGLSKESWLDVYDLSCRHSVQGVAFDALKDLPKGYGPDISLAARWVVEAGRISERYHHIKNLTQRMTDLWKRLGIKAIHLKGVSLADMYPVPEHRICGDIDWYFPEEKDRLAANDWVRQSGMSLQRDSDGTWNYVYDGVAVEHHHLPFTPGDPIEELIMLNLHILKHAMVQGVGLRQISDLAMAYRSHAGCYSSSALRKDLEKKKMLRWTDLLHHVLVDYLGMPVGLLPWEYETEPSLATNPSDVVSFMDLVMGDGNFGMSKASPRSGFIKRSRIFLKYSPESFVKRWTGLIFGRLFRKRKKFRR